MDCIIQGVAKSPTGLSDFHFPALTLYHRKVGRGNVIEMDKQSQEFLTLKLCFCLHMEITYTLQLIHQP